MPTVADSGSPISGWTITQLSRFIRDLITQDPPRYYDDLVVDTLTIGSQLNVVKKVAFADQTYHSVGVTGEPAFKNGWQNFGAGYAAASFVKHPDGWVSLHGIVSNPTNPLTVPSTIFTLPPGYWAEAITVWPRIANNAVARIDIDATGNVQAVAPTSTTAPWITLEGIHFRSKQTI